MTIPTDVCAFDDEPAFDEPEPPLATMPGETTMRRVTASGVEGNGRPSRRVRNGVLLAAAAGVAVAAVSSRLSAPVGRGT